MSHSRRFAIATSICVQDRSGYHDPDDPAMVSARHGGGANVAFCDGHAKWLSLAQVYRDNSLWNGRGTPEP